MRTTEYKCMECPASSRSITGATDAFTPSCGLCGKPMIVVSVQGIEVEESEEVGEMHDYLKGEWDGGDFEIDEEDFEVEDDQIKIP